MSFRWLIGVIAVVSFATNHRQHGETNPVEVSVLVVLGSVMHLTGSGCLTAVVPLHFFVTTAVVILKTLPWTRHFLFQSTTRQAMHQHRITSSDAADSCRSMESGESIGEYDSECIAGTYCVMMASSTGPQWWF